LACAVQSSTREDAELSSNRRAGVDVLERAAADGLGAERHDQAGAARVWRRYLHIVNRLRQVVLWGVGRPFVLPHPPPPLALPRVHVSRLVVAAPDPHRRHDHQELARPAHPDIVHIAEEVPVALIVQVVAQQAGADQRRVQRRDERSHVGRFLHAGEPRLDPIAKLVLRRGQLRRRAEGRPVFVEVFAQYPKRRGQAGRRRGPRCLE